MSTITNNFQKFFKKNNSLRFSHDAYLTANCFLNIYQNSIEFQSSIKYLDNPAVPERSEKDISGFSPAARRRMFKYFTKIDYESYSLPLFISATFHYDFKLDRIFLKKTLDNFLKRLKRSLPPFAHIWKLELQKREAPHFHFMILFEKSDLEINFDDIEKIIFNHWLALKMCNCKACNLYSIKTKRINEFKHALIYISKEIAKVTQNNFKCDLGSYWNHSRNLRIKKYETIELSVIDMRTILQDFFSTNPDFKISEEFKLRLMQDPYSFTLFVPMRQIENSIKKILAERNFLQNFKKEKGISYFQYNKLINGESV